jgi:hypothetical protein
MARQEADREDLLQETIAYPRRGLLALDQPPNWVLLGERLQGAISIYGGSDSVFQFNRDGYLRRVFGKEPNGLQQVGSWNLWSGLSHTKRPT